MKFIYYLLLSGTVLLSLNASAQKDISDQQHAWLMYFGNHRISDRWGLHTEY
jgi:hypothetical protein